MPKVIHTKHKLSAKGVLYSIRGRVARSRRHGARALILALPRSGMPRTEHNTPCAHKSKYGFSAISYALITLLTPVISVATNYSSAFADSITRTEEFNFTVTVNELSTLLIEMDDNLNLDLTPKYADNVLGTKDLDIYVSTSNLTGYTLNMVASSPTLSANFLLDNGTRPAINTLPNITTGITASEFNSSSDGNVINKWGYTLSNTHLTSSDTVAVGKYLGILDSEGNTTGTSNGIMNLNYLNNGNEISRDQTTVTFGANINAQQPAGSYSTTFTFMAVTNRPIPNCDVGKICYNINGATSDSLMDNQDIATTTSNNVTTYTDTTLWASNFKNPSGYGFAGWSSTANYVDSTKTKYYGPNETLSPTELASIAALDGYTLDSGGVTLYANWIPASTEYTMQTFNSTACSAMNGGDLIALRDTRDNNTYTVARLADGKCWMIENLRLDNTATLSPTNTNVASDWTKLTNSINQSTGAIESESNHLTAPSTSGDYWCTDVSTTQKMINCYNQSRLANQNVVSSVSSMTSKNSNVYSYGNYYNWYSATAGYGVYNENSNTTTVTTNNYDITNGYGLCSASWRLPTGGNTGNASSTNPTGTRNVGTRTNSNIEEETFSDFYNLGYALMGNNKTARDDTINDGRSYYSLNTISTNADSKFAGKTGTAVFRSWPNNFLFSGLQHGASAQYRGTIGGYWTSTAYNGQSAYRLDLSATYILPGTLGYIKNDGFTVRCLINP